MSVDAGLIARIRKILARTEEAGCTPAEAEAAYGLASNLMAKHNLDQGEVDRASGLGGEGWADEAVFETARWSGDLDRAAFEGTHANLTTARRPRFPRSLSGGSFNVGLEAGRNLNLSRPVGGTGGPLALSKE